MWALKGAAPVFLAAVSMYVGCGGRSGTARIAVTSPDGGEYWGIGTTQTVAWTAVASVSHVTIDLSTDGGGSWITLSARTPNDGAEPVSVPDRPSTECLVRVKEYGGTAPDTSDAVFEIGPVFIEVTCPNGGETLYVGERCEITWKAPGVSGDVWINFQWSLGGQTVDVRLGMAPAGKGSYTWTVPDVETTHCRVEIGDPQQLGLSDRSDAEFTITRKPIRVVFPNGGESFAPGSTRNITWVVSGVTGEVDILCSINGGATYDFFVATVPAADLTCAWLIPDVSSAQCRVRVQETGGGESDDSDADFGIGAPGGWRDMSEANAPGAGRAFWTGTKMLVWTGEEGGVYDPGLDSWIPISLEGAPTGRSGASAVWTGDELVVWGGETLDTGGWVTIDTGAAYDLAAEVWTPTGGSWQLPGARMEQSAVWTGTEMIVWGGRDELGYLKTGGRYDPVTGTWQATDLSEAPEERSRHTALWTGTEMIVWGGTRGGMRLDTGGRYDPAADSWQAISTAGAPRARTGYTAVWTGSEIIVWGGWYYDYFYMSPVLLNTGARYEPASDTWTPVSETGAPTGREGHVAVAAGRRMIVWGGIDLVDVWGDAVGDTNSGAVYDVTTESWTATHAAGAPSGRFDASAVWTGTEMILWGGWHTDGFFIYELADGGRYTP